MELELGLSIVVDLYFQRLCLTFLYRLTKHAICKLCLSRPSAQFDVNRLNISAYVGYIYTCITKTIAKRNLLACHFVPGSFGGHIGARDCL